MHRNNGMCPSCTELMRDCTSVIQNWFKAAQSKDPTLHMSRGYRDRAAQDSVFKMKLSNAPFGKSPHNYKPAPACDVFFLIDGQADFTLKRYRDLASQLPSNLEAGINFPIPDGDHIQEKGWKHKVKDYPNGNI